MTGMKPPLPEEGVDFSSLPWNLNLPEKHNYLHITCGGKWTEEDLSKLDSSIVSYQDTPLQVRPAMTSLNYGTTIWEGLKCYRLADGTAAVFRADRNYERMKRGAEDFCMPMPSREMFFRSIQLILQANGHLIPPPGNGMKLYVRPMLAGTGQQLGLYPSSEFSYIVYTSPTGDYFKSATGGLKLHLETKRARAARGGTGATKCSGNYAVAVKPMMDAKKKGFSDNLFLELDTYKPGHLGDSIIQEMSAANIFFVLETGEIVTPSIERGTILPGVTRESILLLIDAYGEELTEAMRESTGNPNVTVRASSRDVHVKEVLQATEAFCTGTAAELAPIASLATAPDEESFEKVLKYGKDLPGGPVTIKIHALLREAMTGERVIDPEKPWIRDPYASFEEFSK